MTTAIKNPEAKGKRPPRVRKDLPLNPQERLTFRVSEAIRVTGIGRSKIFELLASGTLKSKNVEGMRLIDGDSLRSLLSNAT